MYPLACIPAAVQLLTYSSTYPVRTSLYLRLGFSLLTAFASSTSASEEQLNLPQMKFSLGFHAFPLPSLHVCTTPDPFEERPFFTTSSRFSFFSANFLILFSGIISCFKTYKSVETSLSETRARMFLDIPDLRQISSLSSLYLQGSLYHQTLRRTFFFHLCVVGYLCTV